MNMAFGYGLLAVAVFVVLSLAYAHLMLKQPPPVSHLLVLWLSLGLGLIISMPAMAAGDRFALLLTNLALYLALSEVYLFVYAAAVGSLSVRILVSMLELEGSPNAFERTLVRYSPQIFFELRLKSLVAQGLLAEHEGRYQATEKGRRWATAGRSLKRLLAVGTGG
jgi:hypothetical protein